MKLVKKIIGVLVIATGLVGLAMFAYLTNPIKKDLTLPAELRAQNGSIDAGEGKDEYYLEDYDSLAQSYEMQTTLSFCGPASLANVLRGMGRNTDQNSVFPTISDRLDVLFSGASLEEMRQLAESNDLRVTKIYASELDIDGFRKIIVDNMKTEGDYLLVNYHRKYVKQEGGGHISPIAAYHKNRDEVLILDTAGYKYPYTWVPVELLYQAAATKDGERSRGLLVIEEGT